MNFYRPIIRSILTGNITAWFGNSTQQDHKALQRAVWSAVIRPGLLNLQNIYDRRCSSRTTKIIKDPSNPNNLLRSAWKPAQKGWGRASSHWQCRSKMRTVFWTHTPMYATAYLTCTFRHMNTQIHIVLHSTSTYCQFCTQIFWFYSVTNVVIHYVVSLSCLSKLSPLFSSSLELGIRAFHCTMYSA